MASYGGVQIFGTAVSMITVDYPRAKQVNSFFGISGLEFLDGGMRGRFTNVTGVLFGQSPLLLANAEARFRSFHDGLARTLVDTLGVTWSNVRLELFEPQSRVRQSPSGTLFRAYRARFLHLE